MELTPCEAMLACVVGVVLACVVGVVTSVCECTRNRPPPPKPAELPRAEVVERDR